MTLVLIDRDGVINKEIPGYVKNVSELKIYPQALEAFALLRKHGFTCVVVTNQSVVGRSIISESDLAAIHLFMCEEIRMKGGRVDDIFTCTDTPERATYRRKPKPGMLIEAMEKFKTTPEDTYFIGDALTDMEAALAAGCGRYLVMTGKGEASARALSAHLEPVVRAKDLLDAARKIAERK